MIKLNRHQNLIPQTPNTLRKNDGKSAGHDVTERKFKLDIVFSLKIAAWRIKVKINSEVI